MADNVKLLGLIPARAGSKRLPMKSLREINGSPLWEIAYTSLSLAVGEENCWIDTDIKEILENPHANSRERKEELAGDTVSVTQVVRDFLFSNNSYASDYDYIVVFFCTNPHIRSWEISMACDIARRENICSLRSYSPTGDENGLYIFNIKELLKLGKDYFYEVHTKAFPCRGDEIHTMEDLERVKREMGLSLDEQ